MADDKEFFAFVNLDKYEDESEGDFDDDSVLTDETEDTMYEEFHDEFGYYFLKDDEEVGDGFIELNDFDLDHIFP